MDTIAQLNAALTGRYEIERELGAGGMATVYLARDARHHRSVAVKVLRPELAAVLGTERFLSEIEVTANLQHPHLLPLFDSGEATAPGQQPGSGLLFYVMPYVEGETLRHRLVRERQLSIEEAVRIARSVASALEYAHRRGVIHRDLKPENILLHEGQPLVADFGIALAVSNAAGERITQSGISLGTPQYMSPEQAAGDRQIDARSDVYSLAAVLYEMLAGEPPHTGPTVQSVISKVMVEEPRPVEHLRKTVPDHVSAALEKALSKVAADRFSSAGEFADALDGGASSMRGAPRAKSSGLTAARHRSPGWPFAVAGLVAGAIGAAAVMYSSGLGVDGSSASPRNPLLATIDLPPEAPLALGSDIPGLGYSSPVVALSADGAWLAWVATTPSGRLVYTRNMSTGETRPLPGTEGAIHAFFSPNGEWVGFLTADRVKKVPRSGGAVISLCEARTPVLAWWIQPDVIYFTENETVQLSRVSVDDRKKESVMAGNSSLRVDAVLPGGEAVLLTYSTGISRDYGAVLLQNIRTGSTDTLIRSAYGARYVAPGYLLFGRAGRLMSVRFDLARRRTVGEPVVIASGAAMESLFGMVHASNSSTGLLAFVPGGDLSVGKLAWVNRVGRRGAIEYLDAPEQVYGVLDLTPDNQRLAVHVAGVKDYIWIWDLARREGRRVPSNFSEGMPLWSGDGRRLATFDLETERSFVRNANANGAVDEGQHIGSAGGAARSWSSRNNVIAIYEFPSSRVEFMGVGDTTNAAGFAGWFPAFSPGDRWIAYNSDQSGANEVFLRSYPEGRVIGQVSTSGGIEPLWTPSGDLIYRNGRQWFSTHVSSAPDPRWDSPRLIFDSDFIDTPGMSWDISADGQRLLVVKRVLPVTRSRIAIVADWFALLDNR